MRKQLLISAVLSAVLISGAAAAPVLAQETEAAKAAEGAKPIRVYTGMISDYEWSDDAGRYLAECSCPQVVLDKETASVYPELAKAFHSLNVQKRQDAEETYQELLEEARERFEEAPDYSGTYTDSETWNVIRADENVVSLFGLRTGYTGGAHGYETFSAVNYDPETGKELKLSEIVTDEAAFRQEVKEDVYSSYEGIDEELAEQYFNETALDDMVWTAGYDGITCYFQAYTLGAYASGSQTVLVPYEGNSMLSGRITTGIAKDYGIQFPLSHELKTADKTITVFGDLSEYYSYASITICVNDATTVFDEDIYTYSIEPTLIRVNGEDYLYLEGTSDNDYRMLDIYRITDTAERIGEISLAPSSIYVEEDDFTAYAAMTDPQDLLLSTRTQLLSTASAERKYRVGEDGTPEAKEEYYRFADNRTLTTKAEISLEEVDQEGKSTGNMTIPAGTKMTMLRTDNDTIVDLSLEDGRIARVVLEKTDGFPHMVNGMDIEEIWDGIMFAG